MKSSLVTMGRNLCVSEFLQSDHTHLLFIDSDILFNTDLIFKMLEKNQEVLSCPYPMKLIQWDNVFDKHRNLNLNKKQRNTSGNMYPVKLLDKEAYKEAKRWALKCPNSGVDGWGTGVSNYDEKTNMKNTLLKKIKETEELMK